jgi:hypothetical protein
MLECAIVEMDIVSRSDNNVARSNRAGVAFPTAK